MKIMSLPANLTSSPRPKSKKPNSSLPIQDEIIVSCFAKVPRCDYPSLSLVSKPFSHLIASPKIYLVRSLSQSTENVLYVALGFNREQNPVWYTLNQKPHREGSNPHNQYKLVPFPSFPSLPCWGASVTVIGHEIYVFGGCINSELTSNVFVIDSRFGTYRFLHSMHVARGCAALGVVDGKIYVIGGCKKADSLEKWIEVLEVETQTWECFSGLYNEELFERTLKSFVMDEKIYVMDREKSFVYDPKKDSWENDYVLNAEWRVGSCVIDNMLYTFCYLNKIKVYDPKATSWTFMKGVEDLPNLISFYDGSRMANHGGRLAILYHKRNVNLKTDIWYTEIALEKRERNEILGKVLWSNLVITLTDSPIIAQCLNVII